MSLESNLLFLVIFGISGYVVNKIFDFNPAEYWVKFGTISIIASLTIAYLPTVFNPEDVVNNVLRITTWFTNILPGVIIGDIAGQIVSSFTGGNKK
ncbi:MAG: hypothetical protein ABIH65_03445 [Nanoarchaeota archaeon]